MELEVQLLGPFAVVYGGQPLDSFRSNKTQALLAYLVTEAAFAEKALAEKALSEKERPQSHDREQLMTLLWPRTPQKSAQVNLRQSLYQLRQAIPEVAGPDGEAVSFILSDRQTVQLNPDARYHLDVARFLLCGTLLAGEPSPDELAEAAALYRGPFLADFHLPDSETFEEWAAGRRATLQRMALEALETLTAHHLERGESEEAERYARRQLALDELREAGHRQLMRALAQQGKRNAAVAHYETYCELLEEELGLEPSAEMDALYAAVREGNGTAEAAPTVRAAPEGTKKRRQLPSPATPFVGRRREMAEITGMLEDGCRLLTLLGPGGSGKTRLAIEVARRRADEYAHGAAFVALAPLSDPANIPTAIATALDFRFTSEGTPREQVLNYLANKELLLVLDNVEHLLDGAELVDDLLQSAPDLRLIATSRARLNLGPEYLFEVGGLTLAEDGLQQEGEGGGFEASEAAALFMEHARRVRPGLEVDPADRTAVARLCQLVEGMPLAIELAASWVRYLPPADIVRELAEDLNILKSERADLPQRQRSMQATFDHSWRLLEEDARDALMKLSVFRGGAGLQAASAVTGASLPTLADLADHSLLSLDPASGRFAVHELIRQIALERLEEAGKADEVRDAHSAYYLQELAERLPDLKGRDQLGALDAIEEDFENVRAAWKWAIQRRQWQHFPQASQSLYLFALVRSRYEDEIELFEAARRAITSPATTTERLARAYALAGGQGLLSLLGLREEALAAVPELRAAAEAVSDPAAVAFCQMMVGRILTYPTPWGGEIPSEATAALDAARAYYQEAQDPFYRAMVLWRLGYANARARQREQARDFHRRALALAREAGDRYVAGGLLHNLGFLTWDLDGPTEAAVSYFRSATRLHGEIGARAHYAFSLAQLAVVHIWRDGDLAQSRPLLEEALAIAAEQNSPFVRETLVTLAMHRLLAGQYRKVLGVTEEALVLGDKKGVRGRSLGTFQRGVAFLAMGDIDNAILFMEQGLSRMVDQARSTWLSTILAYFSVMMIQQGEHERAAELLAVGLTGYHRGGLEIDPLIRRTRAELEEAMGDDRFAAAWERGKELDPMAAAEEVLAALEEMETAG